jgi:hypothetical protein
MDTRIILDQVEDRRPRTYDIIIKPHQQWIVA